jgi:predicted heme/steroid binding protein
MRGSQFATKAGALIALARERSPGRVRTPIATIAAILLVPIAFATAATAAPASKPAPLLVTTTSPLTATAGSAYVAKLDATGGTKPYFWSLAGGTSLPAGLVLHASTGEITGTPGGPAGTSDFIATVTDSETSPASATALESITVIVTPLAVTTAAMPAATAGVAYSATLAAAGGVAPYSWSIAQGSLPAGLKLHAATGVISGTPTAGGNFTFVAEVTDSEAGAQISSASEAITVGVSGLVVTTGSTLPTATSGVPYSVKLSAAGGVTPYQWSLASGSLPAGLKLKSTGVISGTTTATGLDSLTVRVTDSEAPAVSATENVSLSVVTPMVVPGGLPGATIDEPYDTSLQPAGGLGPYSYAISAGSLPPGLALQSDGEITGQASADGTSAFTVSVTDSENPPATVTQAESITVTEGTSVASTTLCWTDSAGNIVTLTVSGGVPSAPQVLVNDQNEPAWVVVNGGTAYWADLNTGTIMALPLTGGTPTVLASGQNDPAYLTVDNGTVYWADSSFTDGTIMSVPVTCGTPVVLASEQPDPISVTATGGVVYWIDRAIHTIMEEPEGDGGEVSEILVNDPGDPVDLAVDSGFAYWFDSGTDQVMAINAAIGGGGTPFVLASNQDNAAYLTVNSGTVYWTDPVVGVIWAVTVTGGIPSTPGELADGQNGPAYLAAGNGTVYWIDSGASTIMSVPALGGADPFVVTDTQAGAAYLAAGG